MKKYGVFGGLLVEVKDDKFMGYPIEGIARLNNRIPYDVMVNVICGGENGYIPTKGIYQSIRESKWQVLTKHIDEDNPIEVN